MIKIKRVLLILVPLILILPTWILANEGNGGGLGVIEIKNPLKTESFEVIIDNLIDFIFKIAIPIVPLMVIFSGFLFVTAGGNVAQLERAKKVLIWTVIGLAILLLSKGLFVIIQKLLEVEGG